MVVDTYNIACVVPPNILDEQSTASSVAVRENQNISLTCRAKGFPAPKIMWRREDGQSMIIDRRKKGQGQKYKMVTKIICQKISYG